MLGLLSWYLTFAQSAPVWDAVPGLPLLQFPWRLLGVLGFCVAIAGAGALAGAMTWIERRWPEQGQLLATGLVVLVGAVTLVNHLGDREFVLKPEPDRVVSGRTVFADEYKDLMGVGTTSNREFLPREVSIATYTLGNPRGRNVYERLYPETEWVGGLFYPLSGDVRILGWRAAPLRIGLRLANDGQAPAQIGIRQLRFPGWRAWLDGAPAPVGVVPYSQEQQASLGFMVLEVPPGEHSLSVVFGPTDLRLGALLATVVTVLLASGGVILLLGRRRGWSVPAMAGLWAVPWLLGVAVVWRTAWPMAGVLAAVPVPPARPQAGVWSAPGLQAGEGALLVNLAEAAATGRAWITSPGGASVGPTRHVDVQQLTVDDGDPDRGVAAVSQSAVVVSAPAVERERGRGHPRRAHGLVPEQPGDGAPDVGGGGGRRRALPGNGGPAGPCGAPGGAGDGAGQDPQSAGPEGSPPVGRGRGRPLSMGRAGGAGDPHHRAPGRSGL